MTTHDDASQFVPPFHTGMVPVVGELFAGAGGLALGFHRAGCTTAFLAEWAVPQQRMLAQNFPGVPIYGDVTQLDGRQLVAEHGPIDVLTGGAPCTDLSVAGKRAGLEGSRSVLFYELIRLWEETGATYCLYENVNGALTSNQGADFAAILSAFVGDDVPVQRKWATSGVVAGPAGVAAWRVLDAQFFGVPHRRRRVFVFGARAGGVDPALVLSLEEGLPGHPAPEREEEHDAPAETARGDRAGDWWDGSDVTPTLDVAMLVKQQMLPEKGRFAVVLQPLAFHTKQDPISAEVSPSIGVTSQGMGVLNIDRRTGHADEQVVGTLKTDLSHQMGPVIVAPTFTASNNPSRSPQSSEVTAQVAAVAECTERPRRLMPVEAERLMSWPDGFTDAPWWEGRHAVTCPVSPAELDDKGKRRRVLAATTQPHTLPCCGVALTPKTMPDGPRYEAVGNGVASYVAEWIALRLIALENT